MNNQDTRNYMQQMKRRNVLQKNNKEKQMLEKIMCLKKENKELDKEVYKWRSKYNNLKTENRKLKEENDRMTDLFHNRE